MKIAKDALVGLEVKLYDAQGNLLEASDAPLAYLHGHADILPRLEEALEGKAPGDTLSVTLEPEDAFGDYDAELVHLVPAAELGAAPAAGQRFEGLPGQAPDGRVYTLTDLAEGMAVLDANHALAGWTLRFDLRVLSVDPPEDLDTAAGSVPDFLSVAPSRPLQ
jgi:FKBP-type peptidyl-prolyl cis-trans isomerase SlyD